MNFDALKTWCNSTVKQPLIMGVLNVTPDSFSDGGCYINSDYACTRALEMVSEGADLIDIGAESSHPGAFPISEADELARLIPVIRKIRALSDIAISVDTYKPNVMLAAIEAGASMINDIRGLQEPKALEIAAKLDVPICIMHMQGIPETMQENPVYDEDITVFLQKFFAERIEQCLKAGIAKHNILLDPGIGFGKRLEHNLSIIKNIDKLGAFCCPLVLGVSRKRMLGELTNTNVDGRMVAGIVAAVLAVQKGVLMVRTHDVEETKQAFQVLQALI